MGDFKITCSAPCGCVGGGWEEEGENLGLPDIGNKMALLKRLPAGARIWCGVRNTLWLGLGTWQRRALKGIKGSRNLKALCTLCFNLGR